MKKLAFIAAVLTTFVANSFAAPSKFFTSGISFTEGLEIARGDNSPKFDEGGYRMTTALSYNAMIGIIPSLYIHPAIGFNLRWYSESDDNNNNSNNSGFSFSASSNDDSGIIALDLAVPVTARYYISNIFFAELGLEFDFNLLEKSYDKDNSRDTDARTLNVGINGGLGFTFPFGLEIGLSYVHGLTNLYEEKSVSIGNLTIKNKSYSYSRINFNIAYWFGYR